MSGRGPAAPRVSPEDVAAQASSVSEIGLAGVLPAATSSLTRIVASVAPATLAIQVLSFGSSIALAQVLGASEDTDAYFLALSVPVAAYAILVAATRLGAIPALTTVKNDQPKQLDEACSQAVTATLGAALALAVALTAITLVVIPLAAAGSPHLFSMTRLLILELAPYAVTGALAGILGAILAVEGKFVFAVLAMGFEPVVKTALVLTVGSQIGVQSLVVGSLVGSALTVGALWALVRRRGIRLRIVRPGRTTVVRDLARVSAPLLLSQSVLQVNPLIDRTMASGVSPGSVTVLDLALRLFAVPVSLLGAVLIGPLTASWSARYAALGWPALRDSFGRVITAGVMILPLLAAVGFALRHLLVHAIYAGGAYGLAAIETTGTTLGMFLIGLPAQVLMVPVVALFIVQKDAVFPLKIAVANVVLNVSLNAGLRGPLGVAGIALSTTVTLWILWAAFVVAARRRWGPLDLGHAARPLALSVGSAILVAVLGAATIRQVDPVSRMAQISLGVAVAAGAVLVHLGVLTIGGVVSPGRLRGVRGVSESLVRAVRSLRRAPPED